MACGVCYVGGKGCGGVSNACWVEGGDLFELPLMFSDAVMQVMVFSTTLWIFSMASPHVHHALPAEFPI